MERVDCVVIGAGVVGLAVARQLAQAGREVIVLERQDMIGTETSSRNSEVIHAGIYYPTGSLKARSCVAGKHKLYAYCAEHGVPHRRCGKLIVATNEAQKATLEQIRAKAAANGVDRPRMAGAGRGRRARARGVLHRGAALALDRDHRQPPPDARLPGRRRGPAARCSRSARRSSAAGSARTASCSRSAARQPMTLEARIVVNSAGLHAPDLAARFEGLPRELLPQPYYCKGNYFTLSGARPFSHLVYPVPEQAGLGVHVTIDLGGQVRFGPDVEWVDGIRLRRRPQARRGLLRRDPDLLAGAQGRRARAGLRRACGPRSRPRATQAADFVIQGPREHGVPGPGQPVRDREPGPDRVAGARRGGRAGVGPTRSAGPPERGPAADGDPGRQHRRMHDRAAPSQPDRARARLRRRHAEHRGLSRPADPRARRRRSTTSPRSATTPTATACSPCGRRKGSAPGWSRACRAACRGCTRSASTSAASAASPTGARTRPRATC